MKSVVMRTPFTEQFDLILTQSIERYSEMTRAKAIEAIEKEWPKQMAVVLEEFCAKAIGNKRHRMTALVEVLRKDDSNTTFLAPEGSRHVEHLCGGCQ
jgi:GTPase Era involved in 16S rRNA processing